MLHGAIIANPSTNIPEVIYITLNNYGSGTHINHLSVSTLFKAPRHPSNLSHLRIPI